MNVRERFLAVMGFEEGVRSLLWEFGYWAGTIRRWYGEGLPRKAGVPEHLETGRGSWGDWGRGIQAMRTDQGQRMCTITSRWTRGYGKCP